MMTRIRAATIVGFAAGMSLLWLQVASGQEIIDRRDQARKWVLTSPQTIYTHYCAHCHGEDGTGGGRLWPTELSSKPADLTSLGESEEYLITAIREGSAVHDKSNLCPPWGRTITSVNTQRLARYVLALADGNLTGLNMPDSPPSMHGLEPVTDPFPWVVCLFIVAEIGLLLVMLRHKKGGVVRVRQDTAVCG